MSSMFPNDKAEFLLFMNNLAAKESEAEATTTMFYILNQLKSDTAISEQISFYNRLLHAGVKTSNDVVSERLTKAQIADANERYDTTKVVPYRAFKFDRGVPTGGIRDAFDDHFHNLQITTE